MPYSSIKFIDLFAGIGGFHIGLKKIGLKCVLASEIDPELRHLYQKNHGIYPLGDIKEITLDSIPGHDIACAGFPCISYSIAGSKLGHRCPKWGGLVDYALDLMFSSQSRVIFLENVDNIVRMDKGNALSTILKKMERHGYKTDYKVFSPDQFGIPQHRKRVYIVGSRNGLKKFSWPDPTDIESPIKNNFLCYNGERMRTLEERKEKVIHMWQCLARYLSPSESGLGGTIFAAELQATYPYDLDLSKEPVKNIKRYKGAYGKDLSKCRTRKDLFENLPPYVVNVIGPLPKWKRKCIEASREIFKRYAHNLPKNWGCEIQQLHNSWQRLEWRGDRNGFNIWNNIIQFRPSGIRVFRRERFPCFVAINSTQTPILGWEKRYVNSSEALKLQGINNLKYNMSSESKMMQAVGNAVNAHIVSSIGHNLVKELSNA